MASLLDMTQALLSQGITAYSETQQVKYQANNPTPQIQTPNGNSSNAGQPAFDDLADAIANPYALVALGVAGVLVVALIMMRR
jgi:hypothetical protein